MKNLRDILIRKMSGEIAVPGVDPLADNDEGDFRTVVTADLTGSVLEAHDLMLQHVADLVQKDSQYKTNYYLSPTCPSPTPSL